MVTLATFNRLVVAAILGTAALLMAQTARSAEAPRFDRGHRQVVALLPPVQTQSPAVFEVLDGQPVLVTFFASWCPPCLDEFQHLNAVAEKYADTPLRIVAINVFEAWDENDVPRMAKFLARTAPAFPVVTGSKAIREQFGGVKRIPTVYGFNAGGDLAYHFIHKRGATKTNASFEELDAAAQALLAAHAS